MNRTRISLACAGLLLCASYASANTTKAQDDAANAARCAELASNQTATFQKRLQAMAPSQSPTTYVDNNTGVRDLLSRISGGGLFSGFNIASYVTGLAGQQLQRDNSLAASSFLGGVNNVLSRFNTPGFNLSSLSSGSVATPPFQPVQAPVTSSAPASTSSLKSGIASFFSPYTR